MIAGALLLAACGIVDDSDDPGDPGPPYTATAEPEPDGPELPEFPMPDTAVGRNAQWIVDQVNAEPDRPPDEVGEHLAADLDSGVWEERFGHLRDQPTFEGALRLIKARTRSRSDT